VLTRFGVQQYEASLLYRGTGGDRAAPPPVDPPSVSAPPVSAPPVSPAAEPEPAAKAPARQRRTPKAKA